MAPDTLTCGGRTTACRYPLASLLLLYHLSFDAGSPGNMAVCEIRLPALRLLFSPFLSRALLQVYLPLLPSLPLPLRALCLRPACLAIPGRAGDSSHSSLELPTNNLVALMYAAASHWLLRRGRLDICTCRTDGIHSSRLPS
jgi:hypothetical protein